MPRDKAILPTIHMVITHLAITLCNYNVAIHIIVYIIITLKKTINFFKIILLSKARPVS